MLLTIFSVPSISLFPLRHGSPPELDAPTSQLRRHNKELAFLQRAGLALGAITKVEQLASLNDTLYQLVHLMNGTKAFVWLVDQAKDDVCCGYAVDRQQRDLCLTTPTPADAQLENGSAETNRSLVVHTEMVRRVREFQEPRVTHRGKESAIFVPVLLDQEVVAIVELVDEHSRRFPLSDVRLLERVMHFEPSSR